MTGDLVGRHNGRAGPPMPRPMPRPRKTPRGTPAGTEHAKQWEALSTARDALLHAVAALGFPIREGSDELGDPALRKLALESRSSVAWRACAIYDRARNVLVERNMQLVQYVVCHFYRRPRGCLTREDLVSEGILGLIRAVEKFDPARDTAFSTYAVFWIRAAIERATLDTARTIRVPVHVQDRVRALDCALAREGGRDLSIEEQLERAGEIGLGGGPSLRAGLELPALDSLSAPFSGHESDRGEPVQRDVADTAPGPGELAEAADDRATARRLLAQLPARRQTVLRLHFGLEGREYTLKEIGRAYGITRERVRQIELDALDALGGGENLRRKESARRRAAPKRLRDDSGAGKTPPWTRRASNAATCRDRPADTKCAQKI